MVAACRCAGFDLVIVETPGIGQGDAAIVAEVDTALYVMTPEFGAASQLEKIEMLDYADVVAINKSDRKGSQDALRDVRKQMQRNREAFSRPVDEMPVFTTMASRFNDSGVTELYQRLRMSLQQQGLTTGPDLLTEARPLLSSHAAVPSDRERYLSEIAATVRGYHQRVQTLSDLARRYQHLGTAINMLKDQGEPTTTLETLASELASALGPDMLEKVNGFDALKARYQAETLAFEVRGQTRELDLKFTTLSGTRIPKVCLPQYHDAGDRLSWQLRENIPGAFPFTAGVFPLSATMRIPPECLPVRAMPPVPIADSSFSRQNRKPSAYRPRLTR